MTPGQFHIPTTRWISEGTYSAVAAVWSSRPPLVTPRNVPCVPLLRLPPPSQSTAPPPLPPPPHPSHPGSQHSYGALPGDFAPSLSTPMYGRHNRSSAYHVHILAEFAAPLPTRSPKERLSLLREAMRTSLPPVSHTAVAPSLAFTLHSLPQIPPSLALPLVSPYPIQSLFPSSHTSFP